MAGAIRKDMCVTSDNSDVLSSIEVELEYLKHENHLLQNQLNQQTLSSDIKLSQLSNKIRSVIYLCGQFRWNINSNEDSNLLKTRIHCELRRILELTEKKFPTLVYKSESNGENLIHL